MSHSPISTSPEAEPAPTSERRRSHRVWQVFWLAFLVVSVGYAGYSFYAPSNDIAWAENFAAGEQRAETSGRPMILFFTGRWCSPCQIMKRQVWADDRVKDTVHAAFVPVTIDVDDPASAELLTRYGVASTPTTVVTDAAGTVLQQVRGRMDRSEFLLLLERLGPAATDDL